MTSLTPLRPGSCKYRLRAKPGRLSEFCSTGANGNVFSGMGGRIPPFGHPVGPETDIDHFSAYPVHWSQIERSTRAQSV